jgi:hypothetical protein
MNGLVLDWGEKRREERDQYIPYPHLHEHCFSLVYIYLILTYKVNHART